MSARRVVSCLALAAAALTLPAPVAFAQDFQVHAQVPARKVGLEDAFAFTVTVEGTGELPDRIDLPALTNLKLMGGPSVSQQFSMSTGRAPTRSVSWTWILQGRATGAAEIGTVVARAGGGERTAPAISLEVVAGSVNPRGGGQGRPDPMADPFGRDPFEEFFGRRGRPQAAPQANLFVEVTPARTTVHVGEPVLLTYHLYTQTAVNRLEFIDPPQYAGFWAEDLERPQQPPSGEGVTVDGQSYRKFAVIQKLLYPTRAGTLTLPPTKLRIGVPRLSVFDREYTVERSTKPVTITVKPLPEEPGFSGAVGRFQASASVDRPSLALGEAATVRFRVEGRGNLKWIDRAPTLEVPGAKVYPPQTKSDLKPGPAGISGSKTWEFVVVPQTGGTLEIPALAFAYFDPEAGRIVTARTAPIAVPVTGAGGVAAAVPAPALPATAGGPMPLRNELDPPPSGFRLDGRGVALVAGVVLLLHAGLWLGPSVGRLVSRASASAGGDRPAARSTRSALRELEQVARGGLSKEQAALRIERTLHDVFGTVDGDPGDRARAVRALLEEVEFVRYAPQLGDYGEQIRDLAGRARDVVRRWA